MSCLLQTPLHRVSTKLLVCLHINNCSCYPSTCLYCWSSFIWMHRNMQVSDDVGSGDCLRIITSAEACRTRICHDCDCRSVLQSCIPSYLLDSYQQCDKENKDQIFLCCTQGREYSFACTLWWRSFNCGHSRSVMWIFYGCAFPVIFLYIIT